MLVTGATPSSELHIHTSSEESSSTREKSPTSTSVLLASKIQAPYDASRLRRQTNLS